MTTALVTIAIFLVMISLHEFGHFIVAKLSGIEVKEFAIGMGPAIFKKQGKETLYSIRLLPIGGYCSLEGENDESDNPRAFCNQKLWKRFLVVVAGAVLNLILGLVIFVVIATQSAPFQTNRIASVDERSFMYQAGVMPGDEIVSINGNKINYHRDVTLYKSELNPNEDVEMVVKRNGEKLTFKFRLSPTTTTIIYNEDAPIVKTDMNGTEIVEENVTYADGFVPTAEMMANPTVTTEMNLGFSPENKELSFTSVLGEAYCNTKFVVKLVYKTLGDMITGKAGFEQVSGPVGVVGAVNTAVKSEYSFMQVLSLTALLTINLGVFNLLPIPALDGGRLFFMLIELVRGKPVPPEKEGLVHGIGLILLLVFAAIISAKDIYMLFVS